MSSNIYSQKLLNGNKKTVVSAAGYGKAVGILLFEEAIRKMKSLIRTLESFKKPLF